jgi:hypothetical protein
VVSVPRSLVPGSMGKSLKPGSRSLGRPPWSLAWGGVLWVEASPQILGGLCFPALALGRRGRVDLNRSGVITSASGGEPSVLSSKHTLVHAGCPLPRAAEPAGPGHEGCDRREPAHEIQMRASASPLPWLAARFPSSSSVGATNRSSAIRERVLVMDPIVVLLVVLIVLALVGSVAVSPLLLAVVVVLVLFAVLGRGRYFARQG